MMLTPEEQKRHRLEQAYCDILGEMDDPLSYTFEKNRYDIWRWDGKNFGRQFVAMTYDESRKMLDGLQGEETLAILVPHVQIDQASWFFFCIAKAGLDACEHMKKAEAAAELKLEPHKPRNTPARGRKRSPK